MYHQETMWEGGNGMKARHIIFDLDGTLWDPTEVSMEAFTRTCVTFGCDPAHLSREHFARAFGHVASDIAPIVLPQVERDLAQRIVDQANILETRIIGEGMGKLFPHVGEVLSHLADTRTLYLCSNCQAGYIEAFLETYGFGHLFLDTICPGDTQEAKPENLRTLITRHGIKDAVMIGDMRSDLEAARANGLPFIHAAYGFGRVEEYDARITSITDLPHLLM